MPLRIDCFSRYRLVTATASRRFMAFREIRVYTGFKRT